jgi:hypothetical protein
MNLQQHLSPSPLSTNPAAALVSANLQSPLSGVGHDAFDAAICSPPSVNNNNNNNNNNGSAKTFANVLHQHQHQPSTVTSPYYYSTKFAAYQQQQEQQQKDQGVAVSPSMFEAKQPHSISLLTRGDDDEDDSGNGISNDLLSLSLPSRESMMMAMLGDAVIKTKINSSGATNGGAHPQQHPQQQQPKSPLAEQFEAVNLIWSRNHQDGN